MILLDTNVISEPMKPVPEPKVLAWLDAQPLETLYLPAPGLAEMLTGIRRLPQGKRRRRMEEIAETIRAQITDSRVLSFDQPAAIKHAELMIMAERKGVVLTFADCQIASIAILHNLTVATRDTGPFLAAGLHVINPWQP